ncbi:hypothetical protein J5N97_028755 [Dioscorea zingiberensis]|uniref:Shugoshin C-terminal domain-containing protein n=1 Tax=Dioscorea zingiberensis TaxID=325984 RepID=A0A9D5H555_9LILI|nr:hypothetical protein J5N97_028755 [Dioscorea zingiberensis]
MEDGSLHECEIDTSINGVGVVGNPKRGRNRKNKDIMGRTTRRKQLSDITNTVISERQGRSKGGGQENDTALPCSSSSDHYAQLLKENQALLMVIEERNKIIEKFKVSLHKASQQNAHLAKTNSMMLAVHELNFSKDRLKALQHEMGCRMAVLKSKIIELEAEKLTKQQCSMISTEEEKLTEKQCLMMSTEEEKLAKKQSSVMNTEEGNTKCAASTSDVSPTVPKKKARNTNRKLQLKKQSSSSTAMIDQVLGKDKDDRCRDLESKQREPTEDSFAMKDVILDSSAHSSANACMKSEISEKKQHNMNVSQSCENQEIQRTSVGRPKRMAAEKVSSYKEIPLNIKMRRVD